MDNRGRGFGGRIVSFFREPFCGISHLTGAVLAFVGLVVLLWVSAGRPWHMAAFLLYGLSLLTLYLASGLYHTLRVGPRNEARLQKFDHCAIFLLIAGTYAPVCLLTLRGAWGWSLLAIEYGLCLVGICAVLSRRKMPDVLRITVYIAMGWLAVTAIGPLRHSLPLPGILWLYAGGLVYSIGTVVFATDRPHLWPGKFSAHDLWHVFVLGGSVCHFVLMLRFVAPAALVS